MPSKPKRGKPKKLVAAVNKVTEANTVPPPELLRKLEFSVISGKADAGDGALWGVVLIWVHCLIDLVTSSEPLSFCLQRPIRLVSTAGRV